MSFNTWNKHFGNLLLGSRSYLKGKQGFLPDWQIKGKGLKEIYAPGQYLKAGSMIRKGVTDRATPLATGIFGIGVVEYLQGKEGIFPDWGRPGQFPKALDTTGGGKGLVNIEMPESPFIEFPDVVIPPFPKVDLSSIGEGLGAGMSGIGAGLAQGLAGLGAGLGGGMPSMPSMELVDEDGQPNVLLLGGLGLIAYMVLKGGKK